MKNVEERLKECQDALVKQGVRDVKFFFNVNTETPVSQVASDAADLLQDMITDNCTDAEPLKKDTVGLKSK